MTKQLVCEQFTCDKELSLNSREIRESAEKSHLEQPRPSCEGRSSSLTQLPQQQPEEGDGKGGGDSRTPDAARKQDKGHKQKKVSGTVSL